MSEQTTSETQATALRIQRALEETLDRHAGGPEAERLDALVRDLREELRAPGRGRGAVLHTLRAPQPKDELTPRPAAETVPSARELELEEEVGRLRSALAAAEARAPAPAGGLVGTLGKMLMLPSRDVEALIAGGAAAEEGLLATLDVLVDFALGLLRAYIPVTQDEDRTMAGMVQRLLADGVLGRSTGTDLAAHVGRTRRQVGGQVLAFRRVCEEGARALLKTLAPAVIEAEAGKQATFLEKRFGVAAQCWELYQKRFEELRTAADLYQAHFDGPLRREMHRLAQGAEDRKGS
jgi:hypothetical protein